MQQDIQKNEEQQLAYALNRPKNNNLQDHQNLSPSTQNQKYKSNQKQFETGQQSNQNSPSNDSPENLLFMNSPAPNSNLFTNMPLDDQDRQQIKRYQTHILMLQGKAYLQLKKPKHALKKLQTALKLNKRFYGEEHVSNASIYTILSQVYSRQKNFQLAIQQLQIVWQLTQATRGPNSKSLASVHLELADVYYKQRDLQKAIENQTKGYEIFSGINLSTPKKNQTPIVGPEIIASVALTLSEWLQKAKRIEQAMNFLSQVEASYQRLFGGHDKRTIKVKRSIAMLYLKINQYQKALNVFKTVQQLERVAYGSDSPQVGKTLKVIGTIQIILNNKNQARQVLQDASIIFQMKGQNKMLKQVFIKLRLLDKTNKAEDRIIMDNVIPDEENERDADLNEDEEKKSQEKRSKDFTVSAKQTDQDKHNVGSHRKMAYTRSGSRRLKNFKMNSKFNKDRMLQPIQRSNGIKTYKSSSSALQLYQNQRTLPPSPLKKGQVEQHKTYYDKQKTLSPINQRAMVGNNGSSSAFGFSNEYYKNLGPNKKRIKKTISQGSIKNFNPSQTREPSIRMHLPQTTNSIKLQKNNTQKMNKMMPFPPKLPRNAWASPPKSQNQQRGGGKSGNIHSNGNITQKRRDQASPPSRRAVVNGGKTSLPLLPSPPSQQQSINQNNLFNNTSKVKNSKGRKIVVSHQRTTDAGKGGQKLAFS